MNRSFMIANRGLKNSSLKNPYISHESTSLIAYFNLFHPWASAVHPAGLLIDFVFIWILSKCMFHLIRIHKILISGIHNSSPTSSQLY